MKRSLDGRGISDVDILSFEGFTSTPPRSEPGKARMIYNKTTDKVLISKDGGVYTEIVLADNLYHQSYINNAKLSLIEDLNALIGTSDIKGFWVFDQTGATTTITDRGSYAHNVKLGGNASTLSPGVAGLCPNLTSVGTTATGWYTADNNDFSFGNGAGVDSAFSLIILINPTVVTGTQALLSKYAASNTEYLFCFSAYNLAFYTLSSDGTFIGRYGGNLSTDIGSWHCYIATASGGSPQAITGLKIYRDGARYDSTNATGGVYSGMTNGTATVGNVYSGNYGNATFGVAIVVSKELTAAEVKRISDRLRAYAGVFI